MIYYEVELFLFYDDSNDTRIKVGMAFEKAMTDTDFIEHLIAHPHVISIRMGGKSVWNLEQCRRWALANVVVVT